MAIDYKPEQNEYKNMTPFKTWLTYQINTWGINNFPFLENDFDQLTNYGMLMKLMKAVNDNITNQNLVEDDMSKLYGAFTELQNYINNYFDNLDVQEEINNKLDEMVENGELESILINYFNFNGYIQPLFGGNIAIYNKSNYPNYFEECGDCFNSVIIDFHMIWNDEQSKFDLRTDYYDDTERALELVNESALLLNQRNVNIKALKFHSTKLTTLTSVNPETLLNAYKNEIEYILDSFTFNYDSIIILNEDNIVEDTDYELLINGVISALRVKYSKPISISKNGVYKIGSILDSIKENLDFYSFNSYGNYSLNGETSSLEDIAKHYDEILSLVIMYKQEKPIYLTEFGCRGSWESFHNAGTDYTDYGLTKPIGLVIEAYFKSKLSCVLDGAYYWYTGDAVNYVPNLLKNIKMKGSVRHG